MTFQLTITDAGRAELINAENNGTDPILISEVGVGTGAYTPNASQTALASETKRIGTIAGGLVGDNIIRLAVRDETAESYTVNEFGLFTSSGTLFAVYSQDTDAIMTKSAASALLLALDLAFVDIDATGLTFPATSFENPAATSTTPGVARFQNDQTEVDPFIMLRPGSFGLGGLLSISDANLALLAGFYSLAAGSANTPVADKAGVLYVVQGGEDADAVHQTWCLSHGAEQSLRFERHYSTSDGWTEWMETGGSNTITLDGDLLIYPGTSNDYLITNYDVFSNYVVESSDPGATATITDDTLTIVVDQATENVQWNLTISRNGKAHDYVIDIDETGVVTPTIESPTEGQTDVAIEPTIYGSAFETYPVGFDTHASTQWQIASDLGFSSLVYDSLGDAVNLEEIPVPANELGYLTQYYVRVRYTSATGLQSEWSTAVSFTTIKEPMPTQEVAKLLASDGSGSDNFGRSVGINDNGTVAVVGSLMGNNDHGAAYVYNKAGGTWPEVAILVANDTVIYDQFGIDVSVSGDGLTIAVGCSQKDDLGISSGAVYIFEDISGTWTQTHKLTQSDGETGDNFGRTLKLNYDGTALVVSAHGDDDQGSQAGAVFILNLSGGTWSETAKLHASDAAASDIFGGCVDISNNGERIIAGAYAESGKGAAYIFELDGTWSQIAKITASNGSSGDHYGRAVGISGDGNTVIVNAYNGAEAYIYSDTGSGWSEDKKITITESDNRNVALSNAGDFAVIGSKEYSSNRGQALLYRDTGSWAKIKTMSASNLSTHDYFGNAVAISGDRSTAIIGATGDDDNGAGAGAAYIFA